MKKKLLLLLVTTMMLVGCGNTTTTSTEIETKTFTEENEFEKYDEMIARMENILAKYDVVIEENNEMIAHNDKILSHFSIYRTEVYSVETENDNYIVTVKDINGNLLSYYDDGSENISVGDTIFIKLNKDGEIIDASK